MKRLIFIGLILISSCDRISSIEQKLAANQKQSEEIANMNQQIISMNNDIATLIQERKLLREELNDMNGTIRLVHKYLFTQDHSISKTISSLSGRVYLLESRIDLYSKINVNLTTKEYHRIDTNCGVFFISVDDSKPYLDGFKVTLNIGNPSYTTYHGLKLNVKWGKDYNWDTFTLETYNNWKESIRSKEQKFTNQLTPGFWNKVDLVIAPANPDELAYIELSMTVDQLSLMKKQ